MATIPGTTQRLYLWEARLFAGISFEDAAKQLHIQKKTMYNWETQKTAPSMENAVKLCTLYNVPIHSIRWEKEEQREEIVLSAKQLLSIAEMFNMSVDQLIEKIGA